MGKIDQKISGDARDLNRALDQVNRKLAQMEEQQQKLADTSVRTNKQATESFDNQGISATQFIGTLGLVAGGHRAVALAINAVNEAYETQKTLQEANLTVSEQLANQQQDLRRNVSTDDMAFVQQRLNQIQGSGLGASRLNLLASTNAAISAKSGMSLAGVMNTVTATAGIIPGASPQEAGDFTRRLIDIQNAAELESPEATAGMLISAAAQSSVTSAARVAQLAGAGMFNATIAAPDNPLQAARESFGLFGAFSNLGITAPEAGTATVKMQAAMNEFFLENQELEDPRTPLGRIRALQGNVVASELFQEEDFAEPRARAQARAMLDPNSEAFRMATAATAAIGPSAELFREKSRDIRRGTPGLQAIDQQRRIESSIELFHLDTAGAFEANRRKAFDDAIGVYEALGGEEFAFGQLNRKLLATERFRIGGGDELGLSIGMARTMQRGLEQDGITSREQPVIDLLERQLFILQDIQRDKALFDAGAANAQQDRHAEN